MAFVLVTLLVYAATAVASALWVGHRPERNRLCAMIAIGALACLALAAITSLAKGITPQQLYLNTLTQVFTPVLDAVADERVDEVSGVITVLADVWVGLCVAQAAAFTFVGCCARYAVDRRNHQLAWEPFSKLDLSVLSVYVLLVGILVYYLGVALNSFAAAGAVKLVGENVIAIGIVPLFVQGAATGKGLLNDAGLSFTWQVIIGLVFLLLGIFLVVIPLIGLVDFWGNFRKLPRDEELEEDA